MSFLLRHDATNQVVKIDIATSCDDLIIESIEQGSSGKGKKVVESDNHDDYVKLKSEYEILRDENKKLKGLMALEKQTSNESLIEENKKLKQEKEYLKTSLSKFTRGQYLQSELLMNTVMKMDRSGICYLANQEKKAKAQQQQSKSKPKPKRCVECGQEDHFAHECKTPSPQPFPKHARPFAFNAHYMLFLGPPNKNRPKKIWVAKSLVEKVKGSSQVWVPKQKA
jgi:hypothetical protein